MNNTEEIVRKINDKLFWCNEADHEYFSYLEFIETPVGDYIRYCGHYLWDSENDYREWIGDEVKEDLEKYLIKELKKILKVTSLVIEALENNDES